MNSISIGSTPGEEDCAQTGRPEAYDLQSLECRAYIAALKLKYGEPPEGCRLYAKSCPHDLGQYREVWCSYPDTQEGVDYAMKVENGLRTWDEVGMWKPVVYDRGAPLAIIRDPALWIRVYNPHGHSSVERRDEAAASGEQGHTWYSPGKLPVA